MNSGTPEHEALLRYLDGRVTPEERSGIEQWLRTDPEARAFVREVAEQSVMVADLERATLSQSAELSPRLANAARFRGPVLAAQFRPWQRALAAAAVLTVLAVVAAAMLRERTPAVLRVSKVTGASQLFGARGDLEHALEAGAKLRAGDTLETRSCDAWVELKWREGGKMTVAGHSTLRIHEVAAGREQVHLSQGTLWGSPPANADGSMLAIQTPTLSAELRGAQFDLQTSAAETLLRLNQGSARVKRSVDGSAVEVTAGHQITVALGSRDPLSPTIQPEPVNHWACDLGGLPEVTLGRWLPPNQPAQARLGAVPLLWPLPDRDPVVLYVAALSVARSSDRPVLLEADSRVVFRGRTDRPQAVRFGFSTQKMRGVFAGKFEVDVRPDSLGPAGETWEVSLPLSEFRPLQPQLSFSPAGLELTDVYALTIQEDAGLEIHHIELVPARSPR